MKSILPLIAFALHAISCQGQKEQTRTFTRIRSLRIVMESGNCELRKSTDGAITASVQFDEANGLTPYMQQEKDKLSIKEDLKDGSGKGKSNWLISLPDDLAITFITTSGKLKVSDVKMTFHGTSDAGALSFTKVSGDLDISIVSGDLDIEDFSGVLNARMGSGTSHISRSIGDLRVTSDVGQIVVADSKAKFQVASKNGNVVGRNVTTGGSSRFTTSIGNAEVRLSATPVHDLFISSGTGDALCAFNGNTFEGKIIMRAGTQSGHIRAPFGFEREEELEYGRNPTLQKSTRLGKAKTYIQVNTISGEAILTP
jgi:hypothetical protein